MPRVSIVVITRNRATELLRTVTRLEALPGRPPVIVVDNGSTDGTASIVSDRHPSVRLIRLGRNRGAAGRNVGVAAAATELVAFSDDDSWWAEDAVALATDLFDAHPRLGLAAGRVLVGPDGRSDPTCDAMAKSPLPRRADLPGPSVLGFLACGAIVRRSSFLAAGGFPEGYGVGGEEAPLALALAARGWDLAYVETLVAYHHPSTKRAPFIRQVNERRNEFWTAWTRLPVDAALGESWRLLRNGCGDPAARAGALHALRGLPTVLDGRDPVPRGIARSWRSLARSR